MYDDEERRAMFGRFITKPHLLSIPPGLHTDFKQFLTAVEDLTKQPKRKNSSASTSSKRSTIQVDEVPSKIILINYSHQIYFYSQF